MNVRLNRYISQQFSHPKGIGGNLIGRIMNQQNRPLYEEAIRLLAPAANETILDIGCGNGYVMRMIAEQSACTLTGIDRSTSAVKEASKRCRKFIKAGKMTILCQNANQTDVPNDSYDKIYTINTVYFWEDVFVTLAEIQRMLKPNGIFLAIFYSNETLARFSHTKNGYKCYTLNELVSAGTAVGFSTDIVPVLGGQGYCAIYRNIEEV